MSFGDVYDPAAGGPPPGGTGGYPIFVSPTPPATPGKGWAWIHEVTRILSIYDGTQWIQAGSIPAGTKAGQILTTFRAPWNWEIADTIDGSRY